MGDHFVLLVDRLLTESTLEAAIGSRNQSLPAPVPLADSMELDMNSKEFDIESLSPPRKVVECRICQDEDLDINMEAPCSCCGSLKYAHRRCVQKWCNEKGDTVCEICHQQFTPNYTAPPPLFQLGRIPLNFRGSWDSSRREMQSARVLAVVSADRGFINSGLEHSSLTNRSISICRFVTLSLMVLLIIHHAFPIILSGTGDLSFPLFLLIVLRTIGIIAPILIMVSLATSVLRRRQREISSDEETPNFSQPTHLHVIGIE